MEEQNNNLISKVDELVTFIKNNEVYLRYLKCSKMMKEDKDIMMIINNIKKLEQELIKNKSLNKKIDELNKEIKLLKVKLNKYPLYQEYSYLHEDLNNLFQQIKEIIQKEIDQYLY